MNQDIFNCYTAILKSELVVALGCTEPIAVAYATAKAKAVLGEDVMKCDVKCSGNIIKNVKGVTVPNSGGKKGIAVAAVLGLFGDSEKQMAVLEGITDSDREKMNKLLADPDFCSCNLIEGVENLYIIARLTGKEHTALVEIKDYHTNITRVEKDGEILSKATAEIKNSKGETLAPDKSKLNIKDILEYADKVDLDEIKATLQQQIDYNTKLSEEGIRNPYGVSVGRTILSNHDTKDPRVLARAYAAAGSDARMSGCPLGAVINSGSGNQGVTVTMPIVVYAKELKVSEDKLYRSLAVANLIALHQKRFIGNLSAYCGAVSAATGAGAGIAYMMGYGYDVISAQITNTIGAIGGMVCDGAKPSCAAKIAAAIDASLLGLELAVQGQAFQSGEGIVKDNVELTIQSVGRMGREGMKSTDIEILNIMLDH